MLLLDAATYKKDNAVVRVVDLVLLQIAAKASNGVAKYLIKGEVASVEIDGKF